MSRNFHRTCTVALEGNSGRTIQGGGLTDLRIAFKVFQSTIQSPNAAEIRIYNPSPATIQQFQNKEFKKVTLTAGYEDHSGVIYSGDIKQSIIRREDAVTNYIVLFCADGDRAYNQAYVKTTLAKGHTPQDRVDVAIKAMAPFGVSLGLVNVDLSQPRYPRGIPLFEMARDTLRLVALSAGATWSLQQGKVHIVDERKPVQGSAPIHVMNSQTGMISWPEQTEDGVIVRSLINPALTIHSKVHIDEASIQKSDPDYAGITSDVSMRNFNLAQTGRIAADGVYLVYFMERSGDSRAGDWYDTSTVIATGAYPNAAQAQTVPAWTLGQS